MNENVRVLMTVCQEARWHKHGISFRVNGHQLFEGDCIGHRIPLWGEFKERAIKLGMQVCEFTKEVWR